jgi:hypothetical protein
MSSSRETWWVNIKCLYVHWDIFFKKFRHFKYGFWVVGASTPMIQSGYPGFVYIYYDTFWTMSILWHQLTINLPQQASVVTHSEVTEYRFFHWLTLRNFCGDSEHYIPLQHLH